MSSSPDLTSSTPATDDKPVPLAQLLKKDQPAQAPAAAPGTVQEFGGRKDGPEPTRYGDWEKNGRCVDF